MKINQVAAQLYTIREHLKTPADIAASLKKIRAIGYEAVQISGMGPIADEEAVQIMKNEGLTCCATHEKSDVILNDPKAVVTRLKNLGCSITAYPYPGGVKMDTLEDVKSFAKSLNNAGKVLHENGLVLAYHNHHMEFRKVAGKPVLEIILNETDPRYLQAELDTYWVQFGGADPVKWCQKVKNRMPIIHLKDYMITPDNRVTYAEVGNGNLDFKSIIAAAEAGGCQWFCVEQDTCPGDPFESLKQSFNYIKENLC